jgi:hypothetical protein
MYWLNRKTELMEIIEIYIHTRVSACLPFLCHSICFEFGFWMLDCPGRVGFGLVRDVHLRVCDN